MAKQYASAEVYERKLDRVMERMGAEEYNYNFDRFGAWVEFRLRGQLYRFDHTREKAAREAMEYMEGGKE